MILLLEVVVDDGEVVKEDGHQVGAVETPVLLIRDILFDKRHTVEIAEEVRAPDFGGINTLVTEFAEEAAVAVVDSIGDTTEIGNKVVGGTSVDMVDSHTGRDLREAPSHIDGCTTNNFIGNLRCISLAINSRDGGFLRKLRNKGIKPADVRRSYLLRYYDRMAHIKANISSHRYERLDRADLMTILFYDIPVVYDHFKREYNIELPVISNF